MKKQFAMISLFVVLCMSALQAQVDTSIIMRHAQDSFAAGRYLGGLTKLDEVTKAYPAAKDIWLAKGYLRLNLRQYEAAQADLFAAAKLDEKPHETLSEFGFFIVTNAPLEDVTKGNPYFDEALKLQSAACEPWFGKAMINYYLKKYNDAVILFEKGIGLCPDKAMNMKAFYADALLQNKQYDKALSTANAVLAENSSLADAMAVRADIYKAQKQYDNALVDLKMLIDKLPKEGRWRSKRALVYKETGQREKACAEMIEAQRLGDQIAFEEFGDTYCFNDLKTLSLKAGSKLTYHVSYYGDEYDFMVKIKEMSSNQIAFDWEMTNSTQSKGSVTLAKSALDTATVFYNYFENGENQTFTDQTTVFVSKKVFDAILNKVPSMEINTGLGGTNYSNFNTHSYSFVKNNIYQRLPCLTAIAADDSEGFVVLNDPKCPLILKMELGWTIELIDFE